MLRPRTVMLFAVSIAININAFATEFKAGEVIVKYKEGVLRTRINMNLLYDSVGVGKVRRYSKSIGSFEHLILSESADVQETIEKLKQDPSVEYAQPNYILYILDSKRRSDLPKQESESFFLENNTDLASGLLRLGKSMSSERPSLQAAPQEVIPSVEDPQLSKAWGLAKIGATRVWESWPGSKEFIVADIDTGIDYNHEDLAFNVWRNPNPSNQKDIVGYDFIHNDGLPYDDQKHGTHTAGTIGAVGGNGAGVSGVAPKVSLMALKFLSSSGSGSTADAIHAVDYAIAHGAKVLNNSWGGYSDSGNQALFDAIERAKDKDILFIAAAGNDGMNNDDSAHSSVSYPAAFTNDNLISVAATDKNDRLAYFSNYGKKTTHLAAPGVGIYSTLPGNKYGSNDGTSMACPHVAGAAALLWSKHPEWNYKRVKDVLLSTVDLVPALADKTITGGRLNILKALNVAD